MPVARGRLAFLLYRLTANALCRNDAQSDHLMKTLELAVASMKAQVGGKMQSWLQLAVETSKVVERVKQMDWKDGAANENDVAEALVSLLEL